MVFTSHKKQKLSAKYFVGNPFFLYSISWLIVLSVYQLRWTVRFPDLDDSLVWFLIITSSFSLFFAYAFRGKCVFMKLRKLEKNYKSVNKYTKITFFLFFCDCFFSENFPLLTYLRGGDMGTYKEVGVPFLHVVVINFIAFLFYFSSYCFFSARKNGYKFLKPMLLSILMPIIYMNRGEVMFLLFGFILIYLMQTKNVIKGLFPLVSVILLILYFFGVAGNFRSNDPSGEYIMKIGGASDDFVNSVIPHEFFWGYVYIATPLGTLQNAINEKKDNSDKVPNGDKVLVHEILPKFISKRLGYPKVNSDPYKVVNELTVGTAYFDCYVTWGRRGMWMVFTAMMLYCIIMLSIVPYKSIVRVPLLCTLSTMTFFSLFSNMITYMAIFPQIAIVFFLRNKKVL